MKYFQIEWFLYAYVKRIFQIMYIFRKCIFSDYILPKILIQNSIGFDNFVKMVTAKLLD